MASSLLELLLQSPSASDRFFSILPMIQQQEAARYPSDSGYSSSTSDVTGTTIDTATGTRHIPEAIGNPLLSPGARQLGAHEGISSGPPRPSLTPGETSYPYTTYDRPFTGTPENLVTRQGITLQRGPMRSLVDIAQASNWMPGAQEIGEILQGYRTHEQQANANPATATGVYNSFHEQGLAIDAGAWSERERLNQLLGALGWNQFDRGFEPWHYSYGVTG